MKTWERFIWLLFIIAMFWAALTLYHIDYEENQKETKEEIKYH